MNHHIKWQPQAQKRHQPPKEPGSGAGSAPPFPSLLGHLVAKWLLFGGASSFVYEQAQDQELVDEQDLSEDV